MTRIKTAVVLLVVMFSICIFSAYKVNNEMKRYREIVYSIENEIIKGNDEKALLLTDDIINQWEESFHILNPFLKGSTITEVTVSLVKIKSYILNQSDDVFTETANVEILFQKIADSEIPYWYNIL